MTVSSGVWVLGNDVPDVEKCISWYANEIPNFADCNVLIVDMTTLGKASLENRDYKQCNELFNGIFARYKTGLRIYCILNESFEKENHHQISLQNYFWCPIHFQISKTKTAKKFNVMGKFGFEKYLEKIIEWEFVISRENISPKTSYSSSSSAYLSTKSIISSQSDEIIGGTFSHRDFLGTISMFPPTNDQKIGIRLILEELGIKKKSSETPPTWIEKILIPGLFKIKEQIESEKSKIEEIQKTISQLKEHQIQIKEYEKLLYADSDDLEEIVLQSCKEIGLVNVRPGRDGNMEDMLFDLSTSDYNICVVEVKSSENNMKLEHVRQTLHWKLDYEENYKPKGLLIANIYRKNEYPANISQRETFKDFEDFCNKYDICIIPTTVIFNLICKKLEGKRINAKELEVLISKTTGTLIDVSSVIQN